MKKFLATLLLVFAFAASISAVGCSSDSTKDKKGTGGTGKTP